MNSVIRKSLLPSKSPIPMLWLLLLTLKVYNASQFFWWSYYVFAIIMLAGYVWNRYNETERDIHFKE